MCSKVTEWKSLLTRIGDDLIAVPASDASTARALADRIRKTKTWLDVVPGMNSVVVRFDSVAMSADAASDAISALLDKPAATAEESRETLRIPVVYGGEFGPDLEEVCKRLDISEQAFIDSHTGRDFPVELLGFTPGFAFVGGLPAEWYLPRRSSPRQRVDAGSIAVAGGRTGLYAVASPGGWNLVGRTPLRLFRPDRDDPFVVRAGMRVRFEAVSADESES